ncbi:DNA-processing protein DprA [Actinoplanes sp. HUAS TT8]|uniref:DNA-processing protein DprA n=1 Tax=Actinoplanes sp. HUAS TT8 TaxID=3447453 RepID=UPI003F525FB2
MNTDDDRSIRAGLSYYAGRALPAHLAGAVQAQGLLVGSWVFPKLADGLPLDPEQALDELRALGRSLRERAVPAATLVVPGDPGWPAGTGCDDLPCLWVKGSPDLTGILDPSVAIIGARAGSGYGLHLADEFTLDLIDAARTIVTSTAPGIDRRVLATALSEPDARTVVVTDQGLDQPFGSAVADAVTRAVARGAVISPFPPGSVPTPYRRMFADQLLCQLASGTVVVQAVLGSHLVLTARRAARAGYRVCAVPGPVTDVQSGGCHQLLREGSAEWVADAGDVINTVGAGRPAFIKPFTVSVDLHSGSGALSACRYGPFTVWAASVAHAANIAFDLVVDTPSLPVDLTVWVQDAGGGREAISIKRAS